MGSAWIDGVKVRGQLTFTTVNEDTWGAYRTSLNDAIGEFNSLSKRYGICVTFVRSEGGGSADVQIEVTDGPNISCTYEGKSKSEEFSGNSKHGRTFLFSGEDSHKIEKVFTFLPKSPQISTPSEVRLAGRGVLKVIAFHELLHALGLSDGDHTHDDVFQGNPFPYPGTTSPEEDGVMIGSSAKHMPPVILSQTTIRLVKRLWCASVGSVTAEVHYKMRESSRQSR